MAFPRPTFSELLESVQRDIEARLPGSNPRLRRSVLKVFAYVIAGVAHSLYGFLDFMSRQFFAHTAEEEYLRQLAFIYSIDIKPAFKASGWVRASGLPGAAIAKGALLQRQDNWGFVAETEAVINEFGIAVFEVISTQTGAEGNTPSTREHPASLQFVSPPPGVNPEVQIDTGTLPGSGGGLTGGSDAENDASIRKRLLQRIREVPHGGAKADYVTWSLEVAGVTRAWVYPKEEGPGSVVVRFMMDEMYEDGIPQESDVEVLQAYLADDERKPVTVDLRVLAPIAVPLDISLSLTVTPESNFEEVQQAVVAEIRDLLRREAKPGGTIYLSHLNEAISHAEGHFDHVLHGPTENVEHEMNEIAILDEVMFT